MISSECRLQYGECKALLRQRLSEPPPARIQLLCGPRQVGKTTLLLELAEEAGDSAVYAAADSPEASTPGFWERLWLEAQRRARTTGRAILLLDEVHMFPGWAARLKGEFDRARRLKVPLHVVASGSSALRLATGSRESLAGRFERLTLSHWLPASLAGAFKTAPGMSAMSWVRMGGYPGAMPLLPDTARWSAYVRDSILEPAIGRDILALASVRRPALLRQVFGVCATSPAQIVSLQKIQGQLQDAGALETIAHYLELLEEAYLVAALGKFSPRPGRRRAAPPKLVTLNNALLAVTDPRGSPDPLLEPDRFGAWLENAVAARAWNAGQKITYWREEPLEVDVLFEGTWGAWAVEVKSAPATYQDLAGLLELTGRFPAFRPLLIAPESCRSLAERNGVAWMDWQQFLLEGLPEQD